MAGRKKGEAADAADALRDEFSAMVQAAVRAGQTIDRGSITRELMQHGVSRATAHRWLDKALSGETPVKRLTPEVRRARSDFAKERYNNLDPADDASLIAPPIPLENDVSTPEMQAALEVSKAAVATLEAQGSGTSAIPVMALVSECVATAQALKRHASNPDGSPRNTKLLLQSSDHLRRTVETAARLTQLMVEINGQQDFHREVLDLVRRFFAIAPDAAGELMRALDALTARWAA